MALNGALNANSELAQTSRLAACQARPYMKIRSRLTRQIHVDHVKSLLDYVIRRFNLSSARLNKPQGLDLR